MEAASESAEVLRKQITSTEEELRRLKSRVAALEKSKANTEQQNVETFETNNAHYEWPLSSDEYTRYGRQMIVPSIGLQGKHFKSRG